VSTSNSFVLSFYALTGNPSSIFSLNAAFVAVKSKFGHILADETAFLNLNLALRSAFLVQASLALPCSTSSTSHTTSFPLIAPDLAIRSFHLVVTFATRSSHSFHSPIYALARCRLIVNDLIIASINATDHQSSSSSDHHLEPVAHMVDEHGMNYNCAAHISGDVSSTCDHAQGPLHICVRKRGREAHVTGPASLPSPPHVGGAAGALGRGEEREILERKAQLQRRKQEKEAQPRTHAWKKGRAPPRAVPGAQSRRRRRRDLI